MNEAYRHHLCFFLRGDKDRTRTHLPIEEITIKVKLVVKKAGKHIHVTFKQDNDKIVFSVNLWAHYPHPRSVVILNR